MSQSIVPCLWFDDQAEAAAQFYTRTFPAGRVTATSYYPQSTDNPSGKPPGSVLTVEFEMAGMRFTALNGGPHFKINPSISFFVHLDSAEEVDALFAILAEGGQVLMPVGTYPWSERYAWVKDRFGVSFQVMKVAAGSRAPGSATLVPFLMFANAQQGKAEPALRLYARLFAEGTVSAIERFGPGEGPESLVKQGRGSLAGQEFIVMDSPAPHAFDFDEGLSLQVMCKDQAEVDHFWNGLTADGGQEGPCGWLKDPFGVSWQVVPTTIAEWMASPDAAARDRAFQAMMTMKKLDVAALQAAFAG